MVAESGGLPEAIGRCGLSYPRHNIDALAACLQRVLTDETVGCRLSSLFPEHLASHKKEDVIVAYLDVMRAALPQRRFSSLNMIE